MEESVLKDVLKELDKERLKRAELEAELFKWRKGADITLENNGSFVSSSPSSPSSTSSNLVQESETSTPAVVSPLSASASSQHNNLDDADRMHIVNNLLLEISSIDDKKRNKRTVSSRVTEMFENLHDSILERHDNKDDMDDDNMGDGKGKSKEIKVNEAVSKVISEYQKKSPNLMWKYDEKIFKSVLDGITSDFVNSIETTKKSERTKHLHAELEKMKHDITTLRTEKQGHLDLINALTPNNDALKKSCTDNSNTGTCTLPLQITQLLEIMPYDDRVMQHITSYDEVHEWQGFDVKTKSWSNKRRCFPAQFNALPINKLENVLDDDSILSDQQVDDVFLTPFKKLQNVFVEGLLVTDPLCKRIYDLSNGYPLPARGTWEWIGGWRIEGLSDLDEDHVTGWSYAEAPEYLITNIKEKQFDRAFDDNETNNNNAKKLWKYRKVPSRKFRRRIWRRQRVLTSYPGISRKTSHILSLHEENAKMKLTVQKLHDQIFKMQNQLTQKEQDMDIATTELLTQVTQLEVEVDKNANELSKQSNENQELKKKLKKQPVVPMNDSKSKNESKENQELKKEEVVPLNNSKSNKSPSASSDKDALGDSLIKFTNNSNSTSLPSEKVRIPLLSLSETVSVASNEFRNKLMGQLKPEVTKQSVDEDDSTVPTIDESEKSTADVKLTQSSKNLETSFLKVSCDEVHSNTDLDSKDDQHDNNVNDINDTKKKETDFVDADADTDADADADAEQRLNQNDDELVQNSPKSRERKDSFVWNKFSRETIMETVKSKVKDVESNVYSVRNNVQAIAEKAHSLQKMANQVK